MKKWLLLYFQAFVENDPDPIAKIKSDFSLKFPDIVKDMEAVEEWKSTGATTNNLVSKFGMACPLPGSFHSSLARLLYHTTPLKV